ncbi:MAG: ATP synthase F0 subunit B [Planctomycetota bacterium]|nr:MAG: ATP synthase F0 subunit B [Planctomycetota bacterium]
MAMLVLACLAAVLQGSAAIAAVGSAAKPGEAADAAGHDDHADHAGHAGHAGHAEIGSAFPTDDARKKFENPAEFRSDLAIWSLAVFGALLALLGQFAWKPIMQGLDKREQGIEHQIAETKAANEEAKRMLVSYERRLTEASDEVRGMLEEARRDAESTRQSIVAEARKAAEDEQLRARHEIGLARDEALASIASKAGELAVEVAGKFLRDKLGSDDHSRLIRDSVASLTTRPSNN